MTQYGMLKAPDEILNMALRKETEARDAYKEMAMNCSVDFVRDLLLRLQDEEYKHMRMIEDMQARLESGKTLL